MRKRFSSGLIFDAEMRRYYVGNMKMRMLAVPQGVDCSLPSSETANWAQRLFVSPEFDEPGQALVDRSRAVANARIVGAVMMLNALSAEQKTDLISLPPTPMANMAIAAWLRTMNQYEPVQDPFPGLAEAYLVSRGLCPGIGKP
ncbi:hypothetical protein CJO79_16775 (plasmid) [Ralstonia solanacearum]|nr:hypothetical protein CJO79_16775 [Ralstonia solanacearum]AXW77597.1 hypothetical protein CJO97_16770 [Ralstonia solanacearum]